MLCKVTSKDTYLRMYLKIERSEDVVTSRFFSGGSLSDGSFQLSLVKNLILSVTDYQKLLCL